MTKKIQNKILTVVVFSALALGSLQFVTWINRMAFENTCITLQEQYIGTEVSEVVAAIENSVSFGKELKNYYGMDELFDQVCNISDGNIKAAVLNKKGKPLYLSFTDSKENRKLLSWIYMADYQEKVATVKGKDITGEKVSLGNCESMVFPIYQEEKEVVGHFLVIYRKKSLLGNHDFSFLEKTKWVIWGAVILFLSIFVFPEKKKMQRYMHYVPIAFIMLGMLVHMLFMYQIYRDKYSAMVNKNAKSAAIYLQSSVDNLLKKGLSVERVADISDYLNQKVKNNVAIESIAIVQNYYNTNTEAAAGDASILNLEVADGQAQLNVVVSRSYITEKVLMMTLTFGAVFIVCLMITYELTHLAEIISVRADKDFNQETKGQLGAVGMQVKLLSFLTYTAIYTSMSYTAVVMRNKDVSLFGLSKTVSSSLPLTVELLSILLCSIAIQKILKDMKLEHLLLLVFSFLVLGNIACMSASSPYILLFLRACCGIGFGFLKYWLNAIVLAGSEDAGAVNRNYAQLNAGLLGGITVGASLGSILAQSFGYMFNYFFTGVLCALIMVFSMFAMPWRMLNARRGYLAEDAKGQPVRMMAVFRNAASLKVIFLGCIPLNIGVMYVVAFLPVYMDNIGYPSITASYAYLLNGLAGVYLGVLMVERLGRFPKKLSASLALLLAAAGILILVPSSNVWLALLSAGIMGLFDGYGTPVITSLFTSLPHVKKADAAGMLTFFNSVGSAVQILCPMLYNLLILPDGNTRYLFLFGICYVAVAAAFLFLFRKKELLQETEGRGDFI